MPPLQYDPIGQITGCDVIAGQKKFSGHTVMFPVPISHINPAKHSV
jgi:hypothetical protein